MVRVAATVLVVAAAGQRRKRDRGSIEELPSGALRVSVYAGIGPVTHRRHYLKEVVPPGPKAARQAEEVRTRFLNQVDEQRNPRTSASVDQLLDRYLETRDVGRSTRRAYTGYLRKHVRPFVSCTVPMRRRSGGAGCPRIRCPWRNHHLLRHPIQGRRALLRRPGWLRRLGTTRAGALW